MKPMYYENVTDYLEEYGTLTKTIIFTKDGEKVFSLPEETAFSEQHYWAVVRCMADSLHPLAGVMVGDAVYKCLRVDDGLLVGRSDTEEFVAYKSEDVVIVGFNDREKAGDCCLTDVKNVERELYRAPETPDDEDPDDPHDPDERVVPDEEPVASAQETILHATVPKTHHGKPKVMFSDGNPPAQRQVNSARGLSRTTLPSGPERDLDGVNEAYEETLDEEDVSFEKIELGEMGDEIPQVAPEEVDLRDMP